MYTDKLEVHILELPKLSKYEYPKTELLEWAHFFAAEKKEEFEVLAKENTYIKKAYNRLTELSADEEKRLEYEAREKAIRDYNWQMECKWRAGHDAGVQQGRLQTLKELLDVGLISIAEVSSLLQTSEQKAEEMIKNI